MSKRVTLTGSDLRILELLLNWRINNPNPTNNGNAIIGEYRLKELLEKLSSPNQNQIKTKTKEQDNG